MWKLQKSAAMSWQHCWMVFSTTNDVAGTQKRFFTVSMLANGKWGWWDVVLGVG